MGTETFRTRDWKMALRTVRWSDGYLAQFREDSVALTLKFLELMLLIIWVSSWWLTYPFNKYLIVLPFIAITSSFAANKRLRSVVRRIEDKGGTSKYTGFPDRLNNWGIQHYSRKAERLLALAENADVYGDDSTAIKYRNRAAKHQATVDKCHEIRTKLLE